MELLLVVLVVLHEVVKGMSAPSFVAHCLCEEVFSTFVVQVNVEEVVLPSVVVQIYVYFSHSLDLITKHFV